jgi:hypothetical protein
MLLHDPHDEPADEVRVHAGPKGAKAHKLDFPSPWRAGLVPDEPMNTSVDRGSRSCERMARPDQIVFDYSSAIFRAARVNQPIQVHSAATAAPPPSPSPQTMADDNQQAAAITIPIADSAGHRLQATRKKVQQDFQSQLEGQPTQDHDLQTAAITRLGDLVSSFRAPFNSMTEELSMLREQVTTLASAMTDLMGMVGDMQRTLDNASTNTVTIAAPPPPNDAPNGATAPAQPAHAALEAEAEAADREQPTVVASVSPVLSRAPAPNVFDRMAAAQSTISRGLVSVEVVEDDMISDFLYHLYRTGKLLPIHRWPELQLTEMAQYHSSYSEKNKIKRCLELVDCLFKSAEERLHYTACSTDPARLEEAQVFFKHMDQLAVQAVVYLQGKMNEPVGSRRKPMVKGTGNAVIATVAKLESWKPHWVKRNQCLQAVDRELVAGHHPNDGELFGPFIERFFKNAAATAAKKRRRADGAWWCRYDAKVAKEL